MSGALPGGCSTSFPQAIIIFGGEKQLTNPQPSVHLDWDAKWNRRHTWAVTLVFQKRSGDKSFSRAVFTSDVASHQERICPYGMKVVIYNGLTAYYWAGSQRHLSKYRLRRWTWCNSTSTWGVHINNRLDRTNKPRGGRILFLKAIPSISGGQQTVQLCWIPISCYSLVLKLTLDATCAYQRYWKNCEEWECVS